MERDVSAQILHHQRDEYAGMKVKETKQIKELEQENSRVSNVLGDLSFEK